MQEQIISKETAKLAKEKGFYWTTNLCYSEGDNLALPYKCSPTTSYNNESEYFSAVTQSLLQKWLREVHSILVMPDWHGGCQYPRMVFNCKIGINGNSLTHVYDSFEEALEAGLQKGLSLIS